MRREPRSSIADPSECVGVELSEFRVTPGNQDPHRQGEIKKPSFGFPCGNQSERELDERFSKEVGV